MHHHSLPRRRRTSALRALTVALAGVAVLASCTPSPEGEPGTAPDPVDSRRGERRDRVGRTTTTTAAPRTTTTTAAPRTTTTTTAPAPAPSPPSGGVKPVGPIGSSGNWSLKFRDEFEGSSLDLDKWRPNWLDGSDTARTPPVNSYEQSCYDPAQVSVSGGMLRLTAERLSSSRPGCVLRDGSAAKYASGLVQTNSDYRFTYGYVEARMFLPGASNRPENWPAFWTNGQSWPRDGEIDVMEVLGGEPRWHYHASGIDQGSGFDLISPKAGWHTFGAHWEPGRITFYYDGREVGSTTRGVVSSPHYLIVNLGLSDHISGPVTTPSTLLVDYVRHWQR